jgi:hypothetical protein
MRQLLLVRSSQPENAFGRFTEEILRSEGLNGFETVDIDSTGLPDLGRGDLIVLTRCFLRFAECDALRQAVERGARLACFSPSPSLLGRLGWRSGMRVVYPGWVRIGDGCPGAGETIQTHVPIAAASPSDKMTGGVRLAEAIAPDGVEAGFPAVARQPLGDGEVVFLFYDLPKAVARIRFGNPDLASHLTSGRFDWPHAFNLFFRHVDERAAHLPQADFHGQLLAKALTDIAPDPLARFWYYPKPEHRSAAVFQSDGDESAPEEFTALSDCLLAHGGTATFFLRTPTKLSEANVEAFRARGHTFGPHPWGIDRKDEPYFRVPDTLGPETEHFNKRFGPHSRSLQSHFAPWMGYASWVNLHVEHGYRLLFAYLSSPLTMQNRFMCGSGRAMRFADENGRHFDCWQQPVITFDDASIRDIIAESPEPLAAEFRKLLDDAVERTHTSVGILSHPVSFVTYSRPYIEACLNALVERGAPIFNGDEWCDFLYRRDAARVSVSRNDPGITCIVSDLEGELPLMIPMPCSEASRHVTVDGKPAEAIMVRRLEQDYLMIPLVGKADRSDIRIEIPMK